MDNIIEFVMYQELRSYFELDDYEMLAKLNMHFDEISRDYSNLECLANANRMDELNEYQQNIVLMYNLLKNLWYSRN